MRSLVSLIIASFFYLTSLAQASFSSYDWDEAEYSTVIERFTDESTIILFEKNLIEFFYDTDDSFREINVTHVKAQLNSDDAISAYNTIYLPISTDEKEVIAQKTRVINKDGSVKELDKSAIKIKKDEETGKVYKYFAVEGIEKESQIEFFFVVKKAANYNGGIYQYQEENQIQKVHFTLQCPEDLFFTFKPLNNAPEPALDSTGDVNIYTFTDSLITKLEHEDFSNYQANLKQIHYKLDKIIRNNRVQRNLINYGDFSQNFYALIYKDISKGEERSLKKILKKIDIQDEDNQREKVFKIEDYLKKNISINPQGSSDISDGYSRKIMTEIGFIRTMANCLKKLDIPHEMVITSDRTEIKFLDDFDSFIFLQESLLYFPELDEYLIPSKQFYRLGLIPYSFTHNKGLFIKEVSVAGYTTGANEIKMIQAPSKDKAYSKMYLNVSFKEDDPSKIIIDCKNESFGYSAMSSQPYFELLDDKTTRELQEELIKFMSSDAEILSMEYTNTSIEDLGKRPLIGVAEIEAADLVEIAGDKLLFKVGDLIGPQMEMYHEDNRKTPIENHYNRIYYREITFTIPEGYTINNLDDIVIDKKVIEEDGTVSTQFVSYYTQEGQTVTIISDEYYDKISYPIEQYEIFQEVVNAAADFNKVIFVLEQTK
ncbi:MAG: DUF3857 domain-containing protein [Bacteroidales bacterium]|jgi:hypothetical protein|nr:DUF3857 domain-containing protein [Bacteroidales bacterium]